MIIKMVYAALTMGAIFVSGLIIWQAVQARRIKKDSEIGLNTAQLEKCGVSNQGVSMDEKVIFTIPYNRIGFN